MKLRILLPAIACVLSISCREDLRRGNVGSGTADHGAGTGYSFTSAQYGEADFSPWVSRAELQGIQHGLPGHQHYARVEGRDHRGRSEYRAVIKAFPGGTYEQWAVFWGINEEKLFQMELKLIEEGFVRSEMQSFKDASGQILNQIVWLRPLKGRPDSGHGSATTNPGGATASVMATPSPESAPLAHQPAPLEDSGGREPTPVVQPALNAPGTQPDLLPPLPSDQGSRAPTAEDHPAIANPRNEPDAQSPDRGQLPGPGKTYLVRQGDTLSVIASRHGVPVAKLKKANQLKSDRLRVGQKLIMPVAHLN